MSEKVTYKGKEYEIDKTYYDDGGEPVILLGIEADGSFALKDKIRNIYFSLWEIHDSKPIK